MLVGLPGVLWVLPDSYIDVKNKDYGGFFLISTLIDFCSISYSTAWLCCSSLDLGDKYINGEIIPCKYPTYQPKRSAPKNESRRYERRRDGPPPDRRRPRQEAAASDSSSTWGCALNYLLHSLDVFGLSLLIDTWVKYHKSLASFLTYTKCHTVSLLFFFFLSSSAISWFGYYCSLAGEFQFCW